MTVVVLLLILLVAIYAVLTQPLVRPLATTAPPVDIGTLRMHVEKLSVEYYPRSYDQRKTLEAAASYVRSVFTETGAEVVDQSFTVDRQTYRNIIARFGPRDGSQLIIGAHYDSYGDRAGGASFPLSYERHDSHPGR